MKVSSLFLFFVIIHSSELGLVLFPPTCKDVRTILLPLASPRDGEYCLNVYDDATNSVSPVQLYCQDMASSSPKEYLTLPSGEQENYSKFYQYVYGGTLQSGGDVYFRKVKLNLGHPYGNISISTKDFTFATILNRIQVGEYEFGAAFGVQVECHHCSTTKGTKINFSGTSVTLIPGAQFITTGHYLCDTDTAYVSADLQHAFAACGGSCGGCMLQMNNPGTDNQNLPVQINNTLVVEDSCSSSMVEQFSGNWINLEHITDMDLQTCAQFSADIEEVQNFFCSRLKHRTLLKVTTPASETSTMVAISITITAQSCEENIEVYSTINFPESCQTTLSPNGPRYRDMYYKICTLANQWAEPADVGGANIITCAFHCTLLPEIIIALNTVANVCDLKQVFF